MYLRVLTLECTYQKLLKCRHSCAHKKKCRAKKATKRDAKTQIKASVSRKNIKALSVNYFFNLTAQQFLLRIFKIIFHIITSTKLIILKNDTNVVHNTYVDVIYYLSSSSKAK